MEYIISLLNRLPKYFGLLDNSTINMFRENLYFLSGEPYPKAWVVWFVGACLLLAIAGGGNIKIEEKQVGKIKLGARILSFVLACIGLFVYFLIPSPHLTITGIFTDSHFETEVNDAFEISLTPINLVKESQIGEHGFFKFSDESKIKKGDYFLSLKKNGQHIVHNGKISFEFDKREVLLLKEKGEYKIIDKEVCQHFINQYVVEKAWMIRYRALRLLNALAKNNQKVVEVFLNLLKSEDIGEHRLASFVLGNLKKEIAKKELCNILEDDNNLHTIFDKLRAASYLSYYPGNYPDKSESFSVVCQRYLFNQLRKGEHKIGGVIVTEGAHNAAANYLSEMNFSCYEVMNQLAIGTQNGKKEIRSFFIKRLEDITDTNNVSNTNWKNYVENRKESNRKVSDSQIVIPDCQTSF